MSENQIVRGDADKRLTCLMRRPLGPQYGAAEGAEFVNGQ
jgi:hypothetical protein